MEFYYGHHDRIIGAPLQMKGTSEANRHQGRCLLSYMCLAECGNAVLCYCILIAFHKVLLKCYSWIQFLFRYTGMKYRTVKAYTVFVYLTISIYCVRQIFLYGILRWASDTKVYFRNVPNFTTTAQYWWYQYPCDSVRLFQNTIYITRMVFIVRVYLTTQVEWRFLFKKQFRSLLNKFVN